MADALAPDAQFEVPATASHAAYGWNQTVDEVNVCVRCEVGTVAKKVRCVIRPTHVRLVAASVAREGEDVTLLDSDTVEALKPDESFWTLDAAAGSVHLTLQKAQEGKSWPGVFRGHGGDLEGAAQESEQKRLLLERFQLEHPGFDFSGAEINGAVPDASTFMGGFNRQQ